MSLEQVFDDAARPWVIRGKDSLQRIRQLSHDDEAYCEKATQIIGNTKWYSHLDELQTIGAVIQEIEKSGVECEKVLDALRDIQNNMREYVRLPVDEVEDLEVSQSLEEEDIVTLVQSGRVTLTEVEEKLDAGELDAKQCQALDAYIDTNLEKNNTTDRIRHKACDIMAKDLAKQLINRDLDVSHSDTLNYIEYIIIMSWYYEGSESLMKEIGKYCREFRDVLNEEAHSFLSRLRMYAPQRDIIPIIRGMDNGIPVQLREIRWWLERWFWGGEPDVNYLLLRALRGFEEATKDDISEAERLLVDSLKEYVKYNPDDLADDEVPALVEAMNLSADHKPLFGARIIQHYTAILQEQERNPGYKQSILDQLRPYISKPASSPPPITSSGPSIISPPSTTTTTAPVPAPAKIMSWSHIWSELATSPESIMSSDLGFFATLGDTVGGHWDAYPFPVQHMVDDAVIFLQQMKCEPVEQFIKALGQHRSY
jgi:hypothetical protein